MPTHASDCPDSVLIPSSAPHGFLIDMDGVIYRGSELIPGADRFVADLLALDLPFFFLTNNSQRTRRDVAMIETATGRKAFSAGKPSAVMMRAARKELGLDAFAYRPDMIVDSIADLSAADLAGLTAGEAA